MKRFARNRSARRAAFTLIEVAAATAGLSLLAGVAAMLLVTTMRANRQVGAAVSQQRALDRLERQLRADIRGATEASIVAPEDAPRVLKLRQSGGQAIEYQWQPPGLSRRMRSSDGQVTAQEHYRISEHAQAAWRVEGEVVSLRMEPPGEDSLLEPHLRAFEIRAVAGSSLSRFGDRAVTIDPAR